MFILVGMDDNSRDLTCTEFSTKEAAWEAMKDELLSVNNNEFKEDYENECDDDGYVNIADDYGIDSDSAWANTDGGDINYDWKIFSIGNK